MYAKYLLPIILFTCLLMIGSCAITEDDTDDIDKYTGTWSVNEGPARINYNVSIEANPSNSAEIILNNFADLGTSAIGLVIGNSVAVDSQSLGAGFTVSGSGSYINSGKLEFNFELSDGIDNESRIAIFTK